MTVTTYTSGLTWSFSRDRMLQSDCARRYYWHYYGSRGGHRNDADEEAALAYRLKQLVTLPMVLGQEVDKRAREIVQAIRNGDPVPALEESIARTATQMNRVWLSSKDAEAFIGSPKRHPMLLERYYGMPVSNDRLLQVRAKMKRCLENLHSWPGWAELRACSSNDIHLFDATDPIEHDGVRMYAAPDLVYRGEDDLWEVLDWKTGSVDAAENQLATYALYLHERGSVPDFDGTCRGRVVDLNLAEEHVIQITSEHLERAARRIRESVWDMRGYLVDLDADKNEALPRERFSIRIDTSRCNWCPFYEMCAGEIENPQYNGPFSPSE